MKESQKQRGETCEKGKQKNNNENKRKTVKTRDKKRKTKKQEHPETRTKTDSGNMEKKLQKKKKNIKKKFESLLPHLQAASPRDAPHSQHREKQTKMSETHEKQQFHTNLCERNAR